MKKLKRSGVSKFISKPKTETIIGLPLAEFKELTSFPSPASLPLLPSPLAGLSPRAEFKASNPKDVFGLAKPPMSTLSGPFLLEMLAEWRRMGARPGMAYLYGCAMAMAEGAFKYARHNYRVVGILGSVYYDAAWRHGMSHVSGELIDPDSGLPHAVKFGACCAILWDGICLGNWTNDRPPRITCPLLSLALAGEDYSDPMLAALEYLTLWWEGGAHRLLAQAARLASYAFTEAFPGFSGMPSAWLKAWAADLERLSGKYPEKKAPYTQKRMDQEDARSRVGDVALKPPYSHLEK